MNLLPAFYTVSQDFWKSWGHNFVFEFKLFFKGKEPLIPVFQYAYDVTSMYI